MNYNKQCLWELDNEIKVVNDPLYYQKQKIMDYVAHKLPTSFCIYKGFVPFGNKDLMLFKYGKSELLYKVNSVSKKRQSRYDYNREIKRQAYKVINVIK